MLGRFLEIYNIVWMFRSHSAQKKAWRDAEDMRLARMRAEARAEMQLQAMLDANPSGQLGNARLNDPHSLKKSELL